MFFSVRPRVGGGLAPGARSRFGELVGWGSVGARGTVLVFCHVGSSEGGVGTAPVCSLLGKVVCGCSEGEAGRAGHAWEQVFGGWGAEGSKCIGCWPGTVVFAIGILLRDWGTVANLAQSFCTAVLCEAS